MGPQARAPLDGRGRPVYVTRMTRVFDMGDRDRLPWRFFGALRGIRAQL
jgi:hypothetical protein